MKRLSVIILLAMVGGVAQAQPEIAGFSMSRNENLYWPRLKRGQSSAKVRVLQKLLNLKGAHLKVDGRFDSMTFSAVCSFQKARKIKLDGSVGAQTWEKLTPSLQRCSRGEAVRIFQSLLARNGQRVKQDGVFGAATEKALRKFVETPEDLLGTDGHANLQEWCWLLGGMNIGG